MTENKAVLHARKIAEDKRADADWNWRHGRLNSDDCIKCAEQHEQLADWIEELQQYRAIGTVEECQEARKRRNGKKVTLSHNGCVKDKRKAFCPNCGLVIHGKRMIGYCSCCGQKLDWSE